MPKKQGGGQLPSYMKTRKERSALKNILTRALRHYHETGDADFYIGKHHILVGIEVIHIGLDDGRYETFPLDY